MATNLITLAEYKTYTSVTSTNQDAQINQLLPIVSNFAKTFCARSFNDYVSEYKVEVFSGGFDKLLLAEYPLIGIQDVEYSADYGSTYTSLVEFTDYVIDKEDDSIKCSSAEVFPKITNGYRVTYNAGYETIPADLKIAVMDLLTYYIKSDMAVKSTRSPGSNTTQVEFITKNSLPSHISRVFDIYTSAWN